MLVLHTGGDETRYKVSILKRKAIRLLRQTLKDGRKRIQQHLRKYFGWK